MAAMAAWSAKLKIPEVNRLICKKQHGLKKKQIHKVGINIDLDGEALTFPLHFLKIIFKSLFVLIKFMLNLT